MKFQSTFVVLASLIAAAFAATVANVESDISNISAATSNLDKQIVAFPNTGGSLINALAIHTAAGNLDTLINNGTADVNAVPKPVAESDAQTILADVQNLEPIIIQTLTDLVNKKAGFASLPIGGVPALVLSDLKSLNSSTVAFENALIASAPADLVPTATTIAAAINSALASAIAAYS